MKIQIKINANITNSDSPSATSFTIEFIRESKESSSLNSNYETEIKQVDSMQDKSQSEKLQFAYDEKSEVSKIPQFKETSFSNIEQNPRLFGTN